MTIEPNEIEKWISDLAKECEKAEWQHTYKEGWTGALTAILIKLDEVRRPMTVCPQCHGVGMMRPTSTQTLDEWERCPECRGLGALMRD